MYEFKKLSDVDEVTEASSEAKALIVEDGEIKKAPYGGGSGGSGDIENIVLKYGIDWSFEGFEGHQFGGRLPITFNELFDKVMHQQKIVNIYFQVPYVSYNDWYEGAYYSLGINGLIGGDNNDEPTNSYIHSYYHLDSDDYNSTSEYCEYSTIQPLVLEWHSDYSLKLIYVLNEMNFNKDGSFYSDGVGTLTQEEKEKMFPFLKKQSNLNPRRKKIKEQNEIKKG